MVKLRFDRLGRSLVLFGGRPRPRFIVIGDIDMLSSVGRSKETDDIILLPDLGWDTLGKLRPNEVGMMFILCGGTLSLEFIMPNLLVNLGNAGRRGGGGFLTFIDSPSLGPNHPGFLDISAPVLPAVADGFVVDCIEICLFWDDLSSTCSPSQF